MAQTLNSPKPSLLTEEALLAALVSIPSVNPRAGGDPEGESKCIDYIENLLTPYADVLERQEVLPGRQNLIARFDGLDRSRSFALEAHVDTVSTTGMTVDPFAATIRDGRLYGRGACDTKGPMTAMLLGLLRAINEGPLPYTWYFIATCDEELGGAGAKALVASRFGFKCDGIVVGEPTDNRPLIQHKGALRFSMTVLGKAAHSAHPELGANACHAAAEWITSFEHYLKSENSARGLSGTESEITGSVGTLRGGDQVNRIPDSAVFEVDLRVPSNVSEEKILLSLDAMTQRIEQQRSGISFVREINQAYPSFKYVAASRFTETIAPLYQASALEPTTARYTTNAGFYAAAKIPTLVFGPGSVEQAHTADEWIELDAVKLAAKTFQSIVSNTNTNTKI